MTSDPQVARRLQDLENLLHVLDLEQVEENVYRGISPTITLPFVFGGQVAAQSLIAAGRTVAADQPIHSMHAYFVRAGDPTIPIMFTVDRVRDGRSFAVRRVVAIQHGKAIFTLSASFQRAQSGLEQNASMPALPDPLSLPTLMERIEGYPEVSDLARLPQPFDLRFVNLPPWQQRRLGPTEEPQRIWLKAAAMPDDPMSHIGAVTFASDLTLLEVVLRRNGLAFDVDRVKGASLDHAMWFHRPFRADEWLLYESWSVTASGSRGLGGGRFFTADGRHVVSVMQEGMLRVGV